MLFGLGISEHFEKRIVEELDVFDEVSEQILVEWVGLVIDEMGGDSIDVV